MIFGRLQNLVKFEKDGEGGGGSTFTQEQVTSAVEEAVKKAVGDTNGLKANNAALKAEKQTALDKVKKFDGITDDDVTELHTFKKEKADLERKKQEDAGKFKDLETQLIAKNGEEVQKKDKRISFLLKEVKKHIVDSELSKALAAKGGQPHLILHALQEHVAIVEDEKGIRAHVIDPATGNPRIADDKGNPMTMLQLVEDFHSKDEWAGAFVGTKQSGMDTTNKNNDTKYNSGMKKMTQTEFSNLPLPQMEAARKARREGTLEVTAS